MSAGDGVPGGPEGRAPAGCRAAAPIPYTFSVPRIDHLGIAVRDLRAAARLYELLGCRPTAAEEVPQEGVRVVMLPLGESRIELLEATRPDSPVGRFLERRGGGLHHVALAVSDLAAVVARLRAAGVRLVSDAIQVGAGGHRYVFLHPSAAEGVLIELIESGESTKGKDERQS